MNQTTKEIQAALAKPFAAEDLEWRLQVAFEDKMQGIAVPYVTNRAIQNRLDDVIGPENWYNDYKPWHGTGKREAQICGISIYFEGRGFITKWDGAEDSDIEPVKGGLSDSMKRAAVQWGIGRVLYDMDTVYVNIERRGKSFAIKASDRPKLDRAYLDMLKKKGLTPAAPCGVQSQLTPKQTKTEGAATQPPVQQPKQEEKPASAGRVVDIKDYQNPETVQWEFTVTDAKENKGMNGVNTSLALVDPDNKKFLAFVRGSHPELRRGAKLLNVKKTLRQQDTVAYYLLESFEILEDAAA